MPPAREGSSPGRLFLAENTQILAEKKLDPRQLLPTLAPVHWQGLDDIEIIPSCRIRPLLPG
jgi:hypothetical protein